MSRSQKAPDSTDGVHVLRVTAYRLPAGNPTPVMDVVRVHQLRSRSVFVLGCPLRTPPKSTVNGT